MQENHIDNKNVVRYNCFMDRERTLKKLQEIFKMGYFPSRGKQSYHTLTPKNIPTGHLVNCFAHTFNLTNELLIKYNFDFLDKQSFQYFIENDFSPSITTSRLLNFVADTGLEVSPTVDKIKSNSWVIALYYRTADEDYDYHFLLKEKSGWSSKMGISCEVETFHHLPKVFRHTYDLYGIYTITNPNIKPPSKHENKKLSKQDGIDIFL